MHRPEGEHPLIRSFNYVSPGYFQAFGTRLIAGRDFTWSEVHGHEHKVIVSENLAREAWGSAANAVGKHIQEGGVASTPLYQVIGVVQDVRYSGVDKEAPAVVYWPGYVVSSYFGPYTPRPATFVVRSSRAGTQAFLNEVQHAVWQVNADLPVGSPRTMQEIYSESMARASFTLVMLGIAASMALALGIIGIYGVISYAVSQRTREIGIRMALGAQKHELRWMFVRSALALTGVGVVLGLVAAAAVARLMGALLFGVSPFDPFSFVTVPVILAAAVALASYLPARRAAALNPVDALKAE